MRWRWGLAVAVGVTVMAAASLWAPAQPELLPTGGACQFAPCGSLEDPERWRLAWWLWIAGAALAIPATAVAVVSGWVSSWVRGAGTGKAADVPR